MIEYPIKKNYLTMIENSVKDKNWIFRNFYIIKDGQEIDVLENGGLSCAVFASSILYMHNSLLEFLKKPHWISFTHANVGSTEKDMQKNGWIQIDNLSPGAVVIWEKMVSDDHIAHEHMGFCFNDQEAVSNDSRGSGFPHKHHITYNNTRKIEKIYWHPELDNG